MDILDEELIELWRSLDKHDVVYLMVGGFATNIHGFSRTTADADLWVKDTKENRSALRRALEEVVKSSLSEIEHTQLIPGWTSIKLESGFEIDLMTYIAGFEQEAFDDVFLHATYAEIVGIKVPFIHLNALIRSKEATNRPKDQIDLIELKKIRESRG